MDACQTSLDGLAGEILAAIESPDQHKWNEWNSFSGRSVWHEESYMSAQKRAIVKVLERQTKGVLLHHEELIDDFIDRMFARLTELGHDVTDCDGDDDPAMIIADWIHGRIKQNDNDQL